MDRRVGKIERLQCVAEFVPRDTCVNRSAFEVSFVGVSRRPADFRIKLLAHSQHRVTKRLGTKTLAIEM